MASVRLQPPYYPLRSLEPPPGLRILLPHIFGNRDVLTADGLSYAVEVKLGVASFDASRLA